MPPATAGGSWPAAGVHDTPNTYDPSGTYTLSTSDFVTTYTNGSRGTFYAGTMTWWGAQAWVHYLDVTNYGGSNQWSLPATYLNQNPGGYPPPQSSSQLAQLFYGELGQVQGSSITTTHNGNYGLFSNVQQYVYWSDTEDPSPFMAWAFNTTQGAQFNYVKTAYSDVLAVAPGEVNAAPEIDPASAAGGLTLLLGGLLVLRGRRTIGL